MTEDLETLDRFSSAICFVLPVREGRWDALEEAATKARRDLDSSWIDDDAAAVVEGTRSEGGQLRPVEVGRGAAGVSVALTMVGYVSDVGGTIAFALLLAAATRKTWQKLRNTKRGIISVSSGAAGLLALADAANRHRSEDIRLVSFGPLDADADRSFSEFDVFWAVVEVVNSEIVEFYLISDKGDVTFAGRAVRPLDPYNRS
ncbi:hypothetical protein AB0C07_27795 [Actinoplanes missouriensis]|uniref:hypothetical protein n=1 Tax=Actinoplanes missouriensis TaxID=1866 RepID=UPI0033D6DD83